MVWDERNWLLALKGDNPHEIFSNYKRDLNAARNAPKIDELPSDQQAWLRAK